MSEENLKRAVVILAQALEDIEADDSDILVYRTSARATARKALAEVDGLLENVDLKKS